MGPKWPNQAGSPFSRSRGRLMCHIMSALRISMANVMRCAFHCFIADIYRQNKHQPATVPEKVDSVFAMEHRIKTSQTSRRFGTSRVGHIEPSGGAGDANEWNGCRENEPRPVRPVIAVAECRMSEAPGPSRGPLAWTSRPEPDHRTGKRRVSAHR
jgi:hypothetical protein